MNEDRFEAISRRAYTVMYRHAVNGDADVFALAHDDVPTLVGEVRRLRDVLELIETAVVDGRQNLDIWDIMNIATNALKGKEDVLG